MKRFRSGKSRLLAALSMVVTASLAGCISPLVRDQAQVDPVVASVFGSTGSEQPLPMIPDCLVTQWIERAVSGSALNCNGSNGEAKWSNNHKSRVTAQLKTLPGAGQMQWRTEAQAELMTYADLICDRHLAGIYASNAGLNFTGGLLTTLLSGGSAIATGRSATNLAAGSALFSGTRSLMNSEIYYGYIGPAVITELRALRTDLRTQIGAKRSCSLAAYPAQESINDALIYHDACSFATGLASLLNKAGVTRVSEDKLRTGQIAVINQQLAEKKAEYVEVQRDLIVTPEKTSLRDKLKQLQTEIREAEAVQRFAGVVDPTAGQPAAPTPKDDVAKLEAVLERLEATNPQPKDYTAKKKRIEDALGTAKTRRDEIVLLQIQIAARQRLLDAQLQIAGSAASDEKARAKAEVEIVALEKAIADHMADLAAAGGSMGAGGSLVSGSGQDCAKPIAQSGTGR